MSPGLRGGDRDGIPARQRPFGEDRGTAAMSPGLRGGDRDGIPARQRPFGEDRGTGGRAAADRPTIIYYVSIVLRCKF